MPDSPSTAPVGAKTDDKQAPPSTTVQTDKPAAVGVVDNQPEIEEPIETYKVLKDFNNGEKDFFEDETIRSDQTNAYQLRNLKIDGFVEKEPIS